MTAEREELNRLRRENRQLRLEREILSKAAAWFARETNEKPRMRPDASLTKPPSENQIRVYGNDRLSHPDLSRGKSSSGYN